MMIVCPDERTAKQARDVLRRHGKQGGTHFNEQGPFLLGDIRIHIDVYGDITEALRRDLLRDAPGVTLDG